MAEKQFQLALNGLQVQQDDLNLLGEASGLADDRVFAELFRMTPYDGATVTKAILPYAHQTSALESLVQGGMAEVVVRPFRAFVSSRTLSNAKKNWRDIRSGLSITEAATDATVHLPIDANGTANPRWDAIVAAIAPDAAGSTVTRKQKDPTTKVISSQTVTSTKVTNVTLTVAKGTTTVSNPAWSSVSIPTDGGGVYYVVLAYVLVPAGFNGTSTVLPRHIAEVAPCLKLSRGTGGGSFGPVDAIAPSLQQIWASSGTPPSTFVPSTLVGMESVFWVADLTPGFETHTDRQVIDTRDWRNRLVWWQAYVENTGTGNSFPWTGGGTYPSPFKSLLDLTGNQFMSGMGQSFNATLTGRAVVAAVDGTRCSLLAGSAVGVAVNTTNGHLEAYVDTAPNARVIFRLDFSAPMLSGSI